MTNPCKGGGGSCNSWNPWSWLLGCCCLLIFIVIFFILIAVLYYFWTAAARPAAAVYGATAAPAAYSYMATTYPAYAHAIPPPTYATTPYLPAAAPVVGGTALYQANSYSSPGASGTTALVASKPTQPSCGNVIVRGHENGKDDCIVCGCDVQPGFANCCPKKVQIKTDTIGTTTVNGCVPHC